MALINSVRVTWLMSNFGSGWEAGSGAENGVVMATFLLCRATDREGWQGVAREARGSIGHPLLARNVIVCAEAGQRMGLGQFAYAPPAAPSAKPSTPITPSNNIK